MSEINTEGMDGWYEVVFEHPRHKRMLAQVLFEAGVPRVPMFHQQSTLIEVRKFLWKDRRAI